MERVYNFSAGPSQLPLEVLQKAQEELLNYQNSGTSILEMSHRSSTFMDVLEKTKANLKELMAISDDYEILFLPGGATTQFFMIPANLLNKDEKAGYVISGRFANLAYQEACRYAKAEIIAKCQDDNFTYIPEIDYSKLDKDYKYLHITGNNTIYGTMFQKEIKHDGIPLIADYSSAILGKWIDVNNYSLIYAGAQKNMGVAGVTIVIIKKDLVKDKTNDYLPAMYSYRKQIENNSMYNTPPCYAIYMCGLMLQWIKNQGGIKVLEKINQEKAKLLYDFIDNSKIYRNNVRVADRSIMNVVYTLPNEELTKDFINYAKDNGLINLKGHKVLGGIRASLYNAMPMDGVKKLIKIMGEFENNVKY